MSKIQLKKELKAFDRDQLVQLILDVYSARKEAKAYFDFFVNPDVEALSEKYKKALFKELNRGKYRDSKARISKIKQLLKEFASYGVDCESQIDLSLYVIDMSLDVEKRLYFSKTLYNGMLSILEEVVVSADKNAIFDKVLSRINDILSGKNGTRYYTNFLRRHVGLSLLS
ncbi:MAG: hypothetical protein K2K84_02185 [Muribaculaceae bacterium]|nr:hypothetical protein [Muribaculaceae bacterium]